MSFSLYLVQRGTDDQTGEPWENEPLDLRLHYANHAEACRARDVLETVYPKGSIEIEQSQEYQARMGRY